MQRLAILLTTASLGAVLGACGSLPNTDSLFGEGTGGATSAAHTGVSSSTTSGPSGTGGFASSSSGSPAASSSNTSATSSSGTATSATATSSVTSTSTSSTASSSSSASSSSGTTVPPVACNGGTCNPGQVCCFNPAGPGDHCSTKGNCQMGYAELSCSSPADCPGSVCCAQYKVVNNNAYYTGASCQPTCDQMGSEFVVCTNDPSVCPPQTMCIQSQLLGQGYQICAQ